MFVRRQANKVVRNLIKTVLLKANFHIYYEIPTYINTK